MKPFSCFLFILSIVCLFAYATATSHPSNVKKRMVEDIFDGFTYEPPGLHPFADAAELEAEAQRDPFGFPTSSFVASVEEIRSTLQSSHIRRDIPNIPFFSATSKKVKRTNLNEDDLNIEFDAKIFTGLINLDLEVTSISRIDCAPNSLTIKFQNDPSSLAKSLQWIPGTRFIISPSWNCSLTPNQGEPAYEFAMLRRRHLVEGNVTIDANGNLTNSEPNFIIRYDVQLTEVNELFLESDIRISGTFGEVSVPTEDVPDSSNPIKIHRPSTPVGRRKKSNNFSISTTLGFYNYDAETDGPKESEILLWSHTQNVNAAEDTQQSLLPADGSYDLAINATLKCLNCYIKIPIVVDLELHFSLVRTTWKLTPTIGYVAKATLLLEADGKFSKKINLWKDYTLYQTVFFVYIIPVPFEILSSFDILFAAQFDGWFSVQTEFSDSISPWISYADQSFSYGCSRQGLRSSFEAVGNASASARVTFEPSVIFKFFKTFSATVQLNPYAEATATLAYSSSQNLPCEIPEVGLATFYGMGIKFQAGSFTQSFTLIERTKYKESCMDLLKLIAPSLENVLLELGKAQQKFLPFRGNQAQTLTYPPSTGSNPPLSPIISGSSITFTSGQHSDCTYAYVELYLYDYKSGSSTKICQTTYLGTCGTWNFNCAIPSFSLQRNRLDFKYLYDGWFGLSTIFEHSIDPMNSLCSGLSNTKTCNDSKVFQSSSLNFTLYMDVAEGFWALPSSRRYQLGPLGAGDCSLWKYTPFIPSSYSHIDYEEYPRQVYAEVPLYSDSNVSLICKQQHTQIWPFSHEAQVKEQSISWSGADLSPYFCSICNIGDESITEYSFSFIERAVVPTSSLSLPTISIPDSSSLVMFFIERKAPYAASSIASNFAYGQIQVPDFIPQAMVYFQTFNDVTLASAMLPANNETYNEMIIESGTERAAIDNYYLAVHAISQSGVDTTFRGITIAYTTGLYGVFQDLPPGPQYFKYSIFGVNDDPSAIIGFNFRIRSNTAGNAEVWSNGYHIDIHNIDSSRITSSKQINRRTWTSGTFSINYNLMLGSDLDLLEFFMVKVTEASEYQLTPIRLQNNRFNQIQLHGGQLYELANHEWIHADKIEFELKIESPTRPASQVQIGITAFCNSTDSSLRSYCNNYADVGIPINQMSIGIPQLFNYFGFPSGSNYRDPGQVTLRFRLKLDFVGTNPYLVYVSFAIKPVIVISSIPFSINAFLTNKTAVYWQLAPSISDSTFTLDVISMDSLTDPDLLLGDEANKFPTFYQSENSFNAYTEGSREILAWNSAAGSWKSGSILTRSPYDSAISISVGYHTSTSLTMEVVAQDEVTTDLRATQLSNPFNISIKLTPTTLDVWNATWFADRIDYPSELMRIFSSNWGSSGWLSSSPPFNFSFSDSSSLLFEFSGADYPIVNTEIITCAPPEEALMSRTSSVVATGFLRIIAPEYQAPQQVMEPPQHSESPSAYAVPYYSEPVMQSPQQVYDPPKPGVQPPSQVDSSPSYHPPPQSGTTPEYQVPYYSEPTAQPPQQVYSPPPPPSQSSTAPEYQVPYYSETAAPPPQQVYSPPQSEDAPEYEDYSEPVVQPPQQVYSPPPPPQLYSPPQYYPPPQSEDAPEYEDYSEPVVQSPQQVYSPPQSEDAPEYEDYSEPVVQPPQQVYNPPPPPQLYSPPQFYPPPQSEDAPEYEDYSEPIVQPPQQIYNPPKPVVSPPPQQVYNPPPPPQLYSPPQFYPPPQLEDAPEYEDYSEPVVQSPQQIYNPPKPVVSPPPPISPPQNYPPPQSEDAPEYEDYPELVPNSDPTTEPISQTPSPIPEPLSSPSTILNQRVIPISICWELTPSGSMTAYYGHDSNFSTTKSIESGTRNQVTSGSLKLAASPPTQFAPGRYYSSFTASAAALSITWSLDGFEATLVASDESRKCPAGNVTLLLTLGSAPLPDSEDNLAQILSISTLVEIERLSVVYLFVPNKRAALHTKNDPIHQAEVTISSSNQAGSEPSNFQVASSIAQTYSKPALQQSIQNAIGTSITSANVVLPSNLLPSDGKLSSTAQPINIPQPSTWTAPLIAAVAVGVFAFILLIIFVITVILLRRKKSARNNSKNLHTVEDFHSIKSQIKFEESKAPKIEEIAEETEGEHEVSSAEEVNGRQQQVATKQATSEEKEEKAATPKESIEEIEQQQVNDEIEQEDDESVPEDPLPSEQQGSVLPIAEQPQESNLDIELSKSPSLHFTDYSRINGIEPVGYSLEEEIIDETESHDISEEHLEEQPEPQNHQIETIEVQKSDTKEVQNHKNNDQIDSNLEQSPVGKGGSQQQAPKLSAPSMKQQDQTPYRQPELATTRSQHALDSIVSSRATKQERTKTSDLALFFESLIQRQYPK